MIDHSGQAVFEEITRHLLEDDKPSDFMEELSGREEFREYPFSLLRKLKATEQSPKYHAEGNVWNHTMLVINEAAKVRIKSRDPEVFMWAALLHDIGKPGTTRLKKGRITSYDHDTEGEHISREFLECFCMDEDFIRSVTALVRYHMHMLYVLRRLPFADLSGLLRNTDVEEIALLCLCDRLGRKGAEEAAERKEYGEFLKILRSDLQKAKEKVI